MGIVDKNGTQCNIKQNNSRQNSMNQNLAL